MNEDFCSDPVGAGLSAVIEAPLAPHDSSAVARRVLKRRTARILRIGVSSFCATIAVVGALAAVLSFAQLPTSPAIQIETGSKGVSSVLAAPVVTGTVSSETAMWALLSEGRSVGIRPQIITTQSGVYVISSDNKDSLYFADLREPPLTIDFSSAGSRVGASITAWGEDLVVIGGYSNADLPGVAGRWSPRQGWRSIAQPPFLAASFPASIASSDEVLLLGGFDAGNREAVPAVAYNPAQDTWRTLPDAPEPTRVAGAIAWTGTEAVIWGGCTPHPVEECEDARSSAGALEGGVALNPVTNSWRSLPAAPQGSFLRPAITVVDDKLYVVGGTGSSVVDAELNLTTLTWRLLPSSPASGLVEHTLTPIGDDSIVLLGSRFRNATYESVSAILSRQSGNWTTIAAPAIGYRNRHAAAQVDAGKVLVAGGYPADDIELLTVE